MRQAKKKEKRAGGGERALPVTMTMRRIYFQKAAEIEAVTGEKISELVRRLITQEWDRRCGGKRDPQNSPGN